MLYKICPHIHTGAQRNSAVTGNPNNTLPDYSQAYHRRVISL